MEAHAIQFREAKGREELLELFRLRYDTYRRSRLAGFVPENASGLDIDEYDPWARHFGLFKAGEAVGYIRVVQEERSPAWADVVALAQSRGGQPTFSGARPSVPFPLMGYFPDKANVEKLYNIFKKQGLRLCSPGRLVISPKIRGIKVANFFIECVVAATLHLKNDITLITCNRPHVNTYMQYGFKNAENIEMENVNSNLLALLFGSPHNLSPQKLLYFKKLSTEFSNNRAIYFEHLNFSTHLLGLNDSGRNLLRA